MIPNTYEELFWGYFAFWIFIFIFMLRINMRLKTIEKSLDKNTINNTGE